MNIEDTAGDGSGVSVCDFDNDGDQDIYVCNVNVDKLYRNDGNTFTDITAAAGLSTTELSRTTSATWGDYDNDGYLDLYIAHHRPRDFGTGSTQDRFYHNNGDGTFTDVSSLLDITLLESWGFIGGFVDYDNDNDLDIILINDCFFPTPHGETRLFQNNGGTDGVTDWNFTNVAVAAGVHDCSNAMGIAVGDINHNGLQDFANSDIGIINFWKNQGSSFSELPGSSGVFGQQPQDFSWGLNLFDHNNDGWLDFFLCSGDLSPLNDPQPNFLLENNGTTGETFTNKSITLGLVDSTVATRNSYTGDYDNDGDLDLLVVNYEGPFMLKQNNNTANNWFKVKLKGEFDNQGVGFSNRDGIGAKVALTTPDGITQTVETRAGSSLGGCEQNIAHFGLGANTSITQLKITWPSGNVQTLSGIGSVNFTADITEDNDAPLSLELINFTATPENDEVLLKWETLSEVDHAYFYIERSSDGANYEKIGIEHSQGDNTSVNYYSFVDESPIKGNNYYRLKMIDQAGSTSFSKIELANIKTEQVSVQVIPNPVSGSEFTLDYYGSAPSVTYEIFDVFGKRMRENTIGVNENKTINVSDFSDGVYFIRVSGQGVLHTEKILIQR